MVAKFGWKYIHTSKFHIAFPSGRRILEEFVLFKQILIQIPIGLLGTSLKRSVNCCSLHVPRYNNEGKLNSSRDFLSFLSIARFTVGPSIPMFHVFARSRSFVASS